MRCYGAMGVDNKEQRNSVNPESLCSMLSASREVVIWCTSRTRRREDVEPYTKWAELGWTGSLPVWSCSRAWVVQMAFPGADAKPVWGQRGRGSRPRPASGRQLKSESASAEVRCGCGCGCGCGYGCGYRCAAAAAALTHSLTLAGGCAW